MPCLSTIALSAIWLSFTAPFGPHTPTAPLKGVLAAATAIPALLLRAPKKRYQNTNRRKSAKLRRNSFLNLISNCKCSDSAKFKQQYGHRGSAFGKW